VTTSGGAKRFRYTTRALGERIAVWHNITPKENRMSSETTSLEPESRKSKVVYRSGAGNAVYCFGLIGACVYYISSAPTFWLGVLGIFKGIIWPAMLVFELMKFLQM
jgi:hypothetical protein